MPSQLHTEFEMCHRVGGHEQFKAEQSRQEMLSDVTVP